MRNPFEPRSAAALAPDRHPADDAPSNAPTTPSHDGESARPVVPARLAAPPNGATPNGTTRNGTGEAAPRPDASGLVSSDDPPVEPSPFEPPSRHPRRRRVLTIAGIVLAVTGAGAAVYLATRGRAEAPVPAGHDHGAAPAAAKASPVMLTSEGAARIGVTYAPVELKPLTRELRAVGIVTYDETRVKVVAPKIDGWIEQLYVNYTGQAVRRGEPLFAVYSPMLVTAQEELLLARRLMGDVAAASADTRRSADDLLTSARRRLAYWDVPADQVAAVEQTGQVRRTLTLRSPVDGYVIDKPVVGGQKIMAGDAVYRIADLSTVWVEGEIFEQYAPLARVGAPVTLEFAASPGTRRTGRVAYLYPTLNQETRTLKVRVALSNPGAVLKPGMYATIRLENASAAPVLTVPRSAVLSTGTRTLVFVKKPDGTLAPQDVTIGQSTEDRIEVLAGLARGDTVVSSATFLIDAESNLKSATGGMGNMPGMNMGGPSTPGGGAKPAPSGSAGPGAPDAKMPDMPGMSNTPGPNGPNVPNAPAGHAGHGGT